MQWVLGSLKAWTVSLYSPPFCSEENVLWNSKEISCNTYRPSPPLLFWGQGWNLQMQHTDEIYVSGHGALQWCRERSGAAKSRVWPWWRCWVTERWCQCILDSGKKRCSFSFAHMCNSQWYREPVLLFLCEVLCQWGTAALVSVSVGASREASPELVLLRQEYGAALVLSVDLHVTLVSLSNRS